MIRSSVVLPEPEGPNSASNSPRGDFETHVVERREVAEALRDVLDGDAHGDSPVAGAKLSDFFQLAARALRSSTTFTTSVTSANNVSSDATAKDAGVVVFLK